MPIAAGGVVYDEPIIEESTPIVTQKKSNFYIGVGVGKFNLKNHHTDEELKSTTASIKVGYDINQYVAIEGRYNRGMKDADYKHGNQGTTNHSTDSKFTNTAAYIKVGYPIGSFKPYALVGYGQTKITNLSNSDRKESNIQYGAGAEYHINDAVSISADYIRAYDDDGFDGRSKDDKIKVDLLNVGVAYHF